MLRQGCYLMMVVNYLGGAKYVIDGYYYLEQVVTICVIWQFIITIEMVLCN